MRRLLFVLPIILLSFPALSQYDSIPHDGKQRTFLLHLPSGYSASNSYALVIAMHGGFGSAVNLQNQSQLSVKADQAKFIVVYPEGVPAQLGIRTWNAGECCGAARDNNEDDVGFISALIDTLSARYNIDADRVYATGMSNGGFMSYRLACELSERIAAIAPVAASMNVDLCEPSRAVPVMQVHSAVDSNVPYQGGIGDGPSKHYSPPLDSVLNAWAMKDMCSRHDTLRMGSDYNHYTWTGCACKYEIEYLLTMDGGHSWPGGRKTVIGDTVSIYVNANDRMWDFFSKFTLVCETDDALSLNTHRKIGLYPNPGTGAISFSGLIGPGHYEIFDVCGRKMMEGVIYPDVPIQHQLVRGVYTIRISQEDQLYVLRYQVQP